MQKLAELEATAPKVTKKKMLNEDSTTPPMNVSNKPASLKDMFETLSENIAQGQKPLPVLDPQKKQAGMGFVTSDNPAVQNILKNLDPKDVQIVQAPGQPQATAAGQPAPAGATGQPQAGQQQMKEKDEGKPGKNFAKIAKSAGERYGSKAAGERVAGAVRAKLAKQGKLEEEQLDELSPQTLGSYTKKASNDLVDRSADHAYMSEPGRSPQLHGKAMARNQAKGLNRQQGISRAVDKLSGNAKVPANEGAKVDRMVKHIEKSERKLGKSKDEAEDIAWATANKRGMLDNKNKKKMKEADIPSTNGIDTMGAGLGAGRSRTTLEGKKPDFLDLDKDGNKKEPMKKAAADKKKKKVDESMNHRISAARLEGKSHGLRGHAHSGKRYEDLEEMKAYHEGYKEGLDECYGQGVYETAMPATVPGMATQALDELSPATLGSYAGKASASMHDLGRDEAYYREPGRFGGDAAIRAADKLRGKAERRHQGINTAVGKLSQPAMEDEMEEGIRDNLKKAGMAAALGATALGAGGMAKGAYDYHKKNEIGMSQADFGPSKGPKSIADMMREDDMEEGNAFTAALAKTPKGGKFTVGGKTFTDRTNYDTKVDEYAFEAWDRELSNLINESTDVNEGLSVSISKGQQNSPDSVTITAQDQEAEHLLAFVKNAGLGLFGDDHDHSPSSAMSIQPAHGAPDEVGAGGVDVEVVDGNDGIMGLMQKLSGIQSAGADDYEDEEGDEEQLHGNHNHEETCNECGMMEAKCDCDKEKVDEVESEDQMEFEVAEDNAPDSGAAETTADENAEAEEDKALALKSVNESFFDILARLEQLSEGSGDEPKHPKHHEKDEKDYDDAEEEEEVKESADEDSAEDLTEWANNAGKKGTDASFEADIDFMTKVIAGGLNKPKSTGQTTVPVIAGQENRMHDHQGTVSDSVDDWVKLAGIK